MSGPPTVPDTEEERQRALLQVKQILSEEELERLKAIRATLQGLKGAELGKTWADVLVLLGLVSLRQAELEENVTRLLPLLGSSATCAGPNCGDRIWWVRTRQQRKLCLDDDGKAHWATCPDADWFREKARKVDEDKKAAAQARKDRRRGSQ